MDWIARLVVGMRGPSIFLLAALTLGCPAIGFPAVHANEPPFVLTMGVEGRAFPDAELSLLEPEPAPLDFTRPPASMRCAFAAPLAQAAVERGLAPSMVIAVAYAETRCRHDGQRSPKGAIGLMQLMPATARRFGATDPWDVDQNIAAGTAYLAWLDKRFHGDLPRMLAAYNAGEGAVDRHNGIPPFAETRAYVGAILDRLAGSSSQSDLAHARVEPVFVLSFDAESDALTR